MGVSEGVIMKQKELEEHLFLKAYNHFMTNYERRGLKMAEKKKTYTDDVLRITCLSIAKDLAIYGGETETGKKGGFGSKSSL